MVAFAGVLATLSRDAHLRELPPAILADAAGPSI